MGLLGDFAKGFVIFTGALWGFVVFELALSGYREAALFFLLFLMVPLSMIMYEYLKNRKKDPRQPA